MKKLIISSILILSLSGCAFFKNPDNVYRLSYAAASEGTQIALVENQEIRPKLEIAYNDLNNLVNSGAVTGVALQGILDTLPIKELKSKNAILIIGAATTLYDAVVGTQINITNNVYVVSATTGIRDGMKVALGK